MDSKKLHIIIILIFYAILTSFTYEPQIREPFEQYQVQQPYQAAPAKAPIDWDNLDYDNPMWGWYYKQLWYLYHPNSDETPPWLKVVPIEDDVLPYLIMCGIFAVYIHLKCKQTNCPVTKQTKCPFTKRTNCPPNKINY